MQRDGARRPTGRWARAALCAAAGGAVTVACTADSDGGRLVMAPPGPDPASFEGGDFAALPAESIQAVAVRAQERVTSVRVIVRGEFAGFDLRWRLRVRAGGDCVALLRQSGRVVRLIRLGSSAWVKRAGLDAAPGWTLQRDGGEVCDVGDPAAEPELLSDPVVVGTSRLRGRPTVRIRGDGDDGARVTRHVTTDRPHLVLRERRTSGDGEVETTDYLEHGEPIRIEAPPPRTVDDPETDLS